MLIVIATALTLTTVAPAQTRQGKAPGIPARSTDQQQNRNPRRFFDGVIGIVGNRVILESEVLKELAGEVESRKNKGQMVSEADTQKIRRDILQAKSQQAILAESAKTLHGATRQQVEGAFENYMKVYEQNQIKKFGSGIRYAEQMKVLGITPESVRDEERSRFMAQLAEQQNLQRRAQDQFALLVTPIAMLEFYKEHRESFSRAASADIEVMTVSLRDDSEAAAEKATSAAKSWRAGKTTAQIEKEFDTSLLDKFSNVNSDSEHAPFIREFASNHEEGAVSEPQPRGSSLWLLKIVTKTPAVELSFMDQKVQHYILEQLIMQRIGELRQRLFLRTQNNFYMEIPELSSR